MKSARTVSVAEESPIASPAVRTHTEAVGRREPRADGSPPVGSASQFSSELNESDALMWSIERDPCLRTTIVAVSLLDATPDWQRLRQRMIDVGGLVPRLRQKVVATPLRLGPPKWRLDENFDIDYHLRRVVCPSPKDLRAVLDMAAPIAMAAFDKDRPLWEFTLVEGLEGGRAAFIQKVHHSFTDGVGGVKLAQLLLDDSPDPGVSPPAEPAQGTPAAGAFESAIESLAADGRAAAMAFLHSARALPSLIAAATHPLRLLESTVRGARSLVKLLAPVTEPLSPLMTGRGLSRRLDAFDVPLDAMLSAAHAAGCTLNDAFLASVTDGLRRYHDRHGVSVNELRVTMPINTRRPGDPLGNNRFVPVRLAIPLGDGAADERMRQLGGLARSWREEPALPFSDVLAG
ncbi:MAG: wax ester/triacylglycerol synthase domain-containing protein, partial [Ilumatobacteraceae bacterium]